MHFPFIRQHTAEFARISGLRNEDCTATKVLLTDLQQGCSDFRLLGHQEAQFKK